MYRIWHSVQNAAKVMNAKVERYKPEEVIHHTSLTCYIYAWCLHFTTLALLEVTVQLGNPLPVKLLHAY